jgi:hypothetical protein
MRAALVPLILSLAACGPAGGPDPDGGPDPRPPAFSDVVVTGLDLGGAQASASITLPQADGPTFRTVFLVETTGEVGVECGGEIGFDATMTLRFELPDGSLPGAGSYEVRVGGVEPAGPSVTVNGIGCNPVGGVRATGGTVTLDVADDQIVEGTLDITLEDGTAAGDFRAHHCDDEAAFVCG